MTTNHTHAEQGNRVTVAARALLARINRHLDGKTLKRAKGHSVAELGAFYLLDLKTNEVSARHVDIEKLSRDLNVLKPWETVGDDVKWRVVLTLADGTQEKNRVFHRHSLASSHGDKLIQERADVESVNIRREAC